MITRPLDLASKLRPEPRSLDWLFFVNAGLLVLFFSVFGSKFVLAPSLGITFSVPKMEGANAQASAHTHHVTVLPSGQILTGSSVTMDQLRLWLGVQAKTVKNPTLLVMASEGVSVGVVAEIASAAQAVGFTVSIMAEEPKQTGAKKGG